ncbi:MAG: aspartate aminotransferase family protein [Chloroflexi bacterium]|uniref:Aspartate aminotransferase family protein n=1 Tax=Candidatus Chlorohelix allophototropha TaxID=3003348 RepID=A0A8T7M7F3_9CHLR|nr:aspartate aminotransferase family protein [Chloroflexota bacterium]
MTAKVTNSLDEFLAQNPTSLELYEEAQQVFPTGATHASRYWETAPGLYFERAQGAYKWDVDGHRYIDYWMGHGSLIFGHSHPVITQALVEQASRGTHLGGNHPGEVRWAQLICKLIPSAEQVRFFSSGTEATMMAMRLARTVTGREKILKLEGRFHGWNDYSSVNQSKVAPIGIPQAVADNILVLSPDLQEIEKAFAADKNIAAVILEADGASYGAVPNPPGLLAGLRDLTRREGALLIYDEIVSGFRYGPGGIQAIEGVLPDLTCLAKILAGGLNGGAVVGSREIMAVFDPASGKKFIRHHGTFNGNPLSAAAGVAALSLIAEPNAQTTLYDYIGRLAERLRSGLRGAILDAGLKGKATSYGRGSVFHVLLGAPYVVELPEDGNLLSEDFLPYFKNPEVQARLKTSLLPEVVEPLRLEMDLRGVQLMGGHGGFVSIAHTEEDIDQTVEAFSQALAALKKAGVL